MAMTVEQIQNIIAGDGNAITDSIKTASESLLKAFDEDISGLKRTNAALKDEKTEISNKWHAEQEKFKQSEDTYKTKLAEAEEQLKKANPDEAKKYFDTQRGLLESGFKSQIAEKDNKIGELTKQIQELENREVFNSMKDEFRKAASKAGVASDSFEIVENYILGPKGSNFTPRDTSEGRVFWSSDNAGDTIESKLEKLLKTPLGKRFLPFTSSGSGAEGGNSKGEIGDKSISRAEFDKLSPAERVAKVKAGFKII